VERAPSNRLIFENAAEISAGGAHSIARRTDGTIWAWGSNTNGQLGDGTISIRLAPVQVAQALSRPNAHAVTMLRIGNGEVISSVDSAVAGASVSIEAIPMPGYRFVQWQVLRGGAAIIAEITNPSQTFTMPNNHVRFRAVFENVEALPVHAISIRSTPIVGAGTVSANYLSAPAGTEIVITATPNTNYRFARWEVEGGGITISEPTNPIQTFIMPNNPVQVRAFFEAGPASHTIAAHPNDSGRGTVTRSHSSAAAGTQITVTAVANANYRFVRWETVSGGITVSPSTSPTGTFTMPNNAVTVRAVFESRGGRGTRTFNLPGQMSISNLASGQSGRSSPISVNVTNLPAGAEVSSISVNVGSTSGTILPSSLRVTSTSRPGHELDIPWMGALNTPLSNTHDFWGREANAVWTISWFGTNTSLSPNTRQFGNVSLTIEYTYTN